MEIHPGGLAPREGDGVWPVFSGKEGIHCDTGRSALALALADWQKKSGDHGRFWAPDYLCHSVGDAAARLGIPVEAYSDRPAMLKSDFPTPGDRDLVLIVHYFGLVNRAALAWLAGHAERRWLVLEDCVQAPYSAGAGEAGDYAIISLRKWWPTPDGAALYSRQTLAAVDLANADEAFVSRRLAAQLLRAAGGSDATFLGWIRDAEALLGSSPPRHCSWIAEGLLGGGDLGAARARRRDNWFALERGVAAHAIMGLAPLFATLAPDEVPLAYPIRITGGRRDDLRSWLAGKGIYCPIHWSLPESASAAAQHLAAEILSLPIDQRYGAGDMDAILECINEFFRGITS